jgi:ribosomal protein S12 methylthiotransferase accessory factor
MNSYLPLSENYLRAKFPLARILSPNGGLLSGVLRMGGEATTSDFHVAASNVGNLTEIFPHLVGPDGTDMSGKGVGGAGADLDPELAWIRAVMEGAERYACLASTSAQFITSTGSELGSEALDLDSIGRCSAREYADPKCPMRPADKSLPIRWVKGYSLIDKKPRMVPAVMSHLGLRPLEGENFCDMISTGIAAHFDLTTALVSAICESIERDAIAISWLARLPLPRIDVGEPPPAILSRNLGRLRQSLLQHHMFDATTDMGVPTAYAVQLLDGHPHLAQYVNCATEFSAAGACAKTIREGAPARPVFEDGYRYPDNIADFVELHDGAAYMGRPEMRSGFDFLLNTPNRRVLADMEVDVGTDPAERLRFLLGRLREKGMDAVAVDLTTDELRELGVWVIRVVIPGLMPMSPNYRARFLDHPRLYEYPERAGYGRLHEDQINPLPQPFA